MPNKIPEPQTIVDSIGGGAIELAEGPVRVAINTAEVAKTFASNIKANMDTLKVGMPEDLSAIPDFVVRAAGHTIADGLSFFDGIGKGVTETLEGVKNQIRRVTG